MKGHIPQLTGVRALAALWVMVFHFRPQIVWSFGFLHPLIPLMNTGYLGVDLFFGLSGFILTWTHMDRMVQRYSWRKAVGFLWLRLSRIWPLTVFMLIVWGAFNLAVLAHEDNGNPLSALNPSRFLAHVFLVQAWTTADHDWNGVDWSLSAEWMAYLAFSVLVVLVAGLSRVVSNRGLVLLAFFSVLPFVLVGMSMQDGSDLTFYNDSVVPGIVPLRVLSEFFGGAMVSLLVMRYKGRDRLPIFLQPTLVFAAIIALLFLIPAYFPAARLKDNWDWRIYNHLMQSTIATVVVVPLFLVLIGTLALSRRDLFTRFLSTRLLVWGGKISFALYMCHWLFLVMLQHFLNSHPAIANNPSSLTCKLVVLGALASAIIAAHLLYTFVEEKAQRVMRQLTPPSFKI